MQTYDIVRRSSLWRKAASKICNHQRKRHRRALSEPLGRLTSGDLVGFRDGATAYLAASKLPVELYRPAFLALTQPDLTLEEHRAITADLLEAQNGTGVTSGTIFAWVSLGTLLTSAGLIEAGQMARERAKDFLAALDDVPLGLRIPALQAAMEVGDFPRAQKLLHAVRFALKAEEYDAGLRVISLLSGEEAPAGAPASLADLQKVVHGRSVAVVAPSTGGPEDLSEEVESFDRVIRFNYFGPQSIAPGSGFRTDIAYYASQTIRGSKARDDLSPLSAVKTILVKLPRDVPFLASRLQGDNDVALGVPLDHLFYACAPNALPIALTQVLLSGPASLKVFNANLYTRLGYPEGYYDSVEKAQHYASKRHMCMVFGNIHSPMAQMRYLKLLRGTGRVAGDSTFSAVMGMTEWEYLQDLDRAHGLHAWGSL